jgi:transcriptional regulator
MYRPSHFRLDDEAAAFRLIAEYGFATLACVADGRAVFSQLPMIADVKRRVLRGHLARPNPQAALLGGRRATALFTGAEGYISPNWCADRTRVPTWNFESVEVEGDVRVIESDDEVDRFLIDLSAHFEARRHDLDRDMPWTIDKLPLEKRVRLRKGIVAFEIAIDRLEMKSKMSQNADAADRAGVISALSSGDEAQRALAMAMREVIRHD